MSRVRWFAVLLVAGFALVGCGVDFLPWSAPLPDSSVAVRETPSGAVEALLVPCSPVRISRFEVVVLRGVGDRAGDPRVWQVDFSPPVTDLRTVTLGVVPAGGTETVPWPATGLPGREEDAGYAVQVVLGDGEIWDQDFQRESDLADGRIRFQYQNMSPEDFAEASRCP